MRIEKIFPILAAVAIGAVVARSAAGPNWRGTLKHRLGPRGTTFLRCLVRGKRLPRWGNLKNVNEPFSSIWGFDRGTPVDRFFGDRFFDENRHLITGKVLEIQKPVYTQQYGVGVTQADSIDIDSAPNPTIVCDLAESEGVIPDNTYDTFLLPYTLLVVKNLEPALRHAMRIVKPGGTILATTSVMTPVLADYPEYWRMTEHGWRELLPKVWPGAKFEVATHGNCVSAVASILGLAQEELSLKDLEHHDPRFPVVISIKATKPA